MMFLVRFIRFFDKYMEQHKSVIRNIVFMNSLSILKYSEYKNIKPFSESIYLNALELG